MPIGLPAKRKTSTKKRDLTVRGASGPLKLSKRQEAQLRHLTELKKQATERWLYKNRPDYRRRANQRLAVEQGKYSHLPKPVVACLRGLANEDHYVRLDTLRKLEWMWPEKTASPKSIPPEVVSSLIDTLKARDEFDSVQEHCVSILGKIGGERAKKALLEELNAGRVSTSLSYALNEACITEAVPMLQRKFSKMDYGDDLYNATAHTLGDLGNAGTVKYLIDGLDKGARKGYPANHSICHALETLLKKPGTIDHLKKLPREEKLRIVNVIITALKHPIVAELHGMFGPVERDSLIRSAHLLLGGETVIERRGHLRIEDVKRLLK